MTSTEHRNPEPPGGSGDQLQADRELTREELAGTVQALAAKADVAGRSKQAAHDYVRAAQDRAADLAVRVRRTGEAWAGPLWIPIAALAGPAAVAVSVLAVAKSRRPRRR
ncbi:MAG: DUF3618 domain-containing protein [Pseudonocardiaceae bacterium]|nr:DUF3618 domain-containing protein [Pseudonocardiaceae bacterium]